jgi:hypothetical protein
MNQLTFALLFSAVESIYTFLVAFTLDIGERSEGNKVKSYCNITYECRRSVLGEGRDLVVSG